MPYWFEPQSVSLELGGTPLKIETGRMAKQAAGAAVVSYGDTVVLVTVTTSKPREGIDFFPLTVDFVEKTSAAGKIPGGFFKREARLSDREILVCRFIDRSIRPLFAEGFRDEVQVTATVLAHDGKNPPDLAAFVGASAALSISQIPFLGPIGAVRLGRIDGQWVVNPTHDEQAESDLELVVAGSKAALVMVEGGAREIPEADVLAALQFAHKEIQPLIEIQNDLVSRVGKEKIVPQLPAPIDGLEERVRAAAEARLREAVAIQTKAERYDAISAVEKEVVADFVDAYRKEPATLDTLESAVEPDARADPE
jgi:polyribonucleotide nucleotidyltransferase